MYEVWEEWCAHYRDVKTGKKICVYDILFGQEYLWMGPVHKCTHVSMRMRVDAHMFVCVCVCVCVCVGMCVRAFVCVVTMCTL